MSKRNNKIPTRSGSVASLGSASVASNSSKRSRDDVESPGDATEIETFGDLWMKMEQLIQRSNSEIQNKIESCKTSLENRINQIESKLESLQADCTAKVNTLSAAVDEIRYELDFTHESIERLANSSDLIISGIPFNQNEELQQVFQKIAVQLGYSNDIPVVDLRRLSKQPVASGTSPPIVCQFTLRNIRNDFYRRYLQQRDLNTQHVGLEDNKRIYINENLTLQARDIRNKAIKLKKEGRITNVFSRDGIVHVKQPGKEIEPIHTIDDLSSKFK